MSKQEIIMDMNPVLEGFEPQATYRPVNKGETVYILGRNGEPIKFICQNRHEDWAFVLTPTRVVMVTNTNTIAQYRDKQFLNKEELKNTITHRRSLRASVGYLMCLYDNFDKLSIPLDKAQRIVDGMEEARDIEEALDEALSDDD